MTVDEAAVMTVFAEYWSVSPGHEESWRAYFETVIVPANASCGGYLGCSIMRRSAWWRDPEAGARRVLQPHFGLRLGGQRTSVSVNLSALLQHEYTFLAIHEWSQSPSGTFLDDWLAAWERLRPDWRRDHADVDDPMEALSREFFSLVDNHWDVTYEVVGSVGRPDPGA